MSSWFCKVVLCLASAKHCRAPPLVHCHPAMTTGNLQHDLMSNSYSQPNPLSCTQRTHLYCLTKVASWHLGGGSAVAPMLFLHLDGWRVVAPILRMHNDVGRPMAQLTQSHDTTIVCKIKIKFHISSIFLYT